MTQLEQPSKAAPRPPTPPPGGGQPWYRRRRWWIVGSAALVFVVGGVIGGLVGTSGTDNAATTAPSVSTTAPNGGATTPGPGATVPASGAAATALTTALTAEHEAKATYDNVIARFGAVRPFATVSSAEAQHIDSLQTLAQRYGVTLPPGPFAGQPSPSTLTEACQLGVTTEQQVISTYDQLLAQVSGYGDLTQGFSNLQAAARDNHLPAFERCS